MAEKEGFEDAVCFLCSEKLLFSAYFPSNYSFYGLFYASYCTVFKSLRGIFWGRISTSKIVQTTVSLCGFGAASCRMFEESTDRVSRPAFSGRFFMLKCDTSEFFNESSFRRRGICPRYLEFSACLKENRVKIFLFSIAG